MSGLEEHSCKNVLVIGVGNELMRDDGVGIAVVRELKKLNLPSNITLIEAGSNMLEILFSLKSKASVDVVVIVDAIDFKSEPGSILIVSPESSWEFTQSMVKAFDPHGLTVKDVLDMAGAIGIKLNKVYVIGCQPERISLGLGLSEKVKKAVGKIIETILDIVEKECVEEGILKKG